MNTGPLDLDANRHWLAERFAARLFRLAPASVLDVGCGRGALLAACRANGVRAVGVEPSDEAAALARAEGLDARTRAGDVLPFEDGEFDWVTLRHVPHHLERPDAVLGEAWRVARCGVLVAEPWFEDALPGQREAREVDRFLKRLDRARGRFHADVLAPGTLAGFLRSAAAWELEAWVRAEPMLRADFEVELARAVASTPLRQDEADEAARLVEGVAAGRVGLPGSVALTAVRTV